ncbi:MAG: hypothetical protein JXA99_15190 [Candidatus Lokiarchaeota archaeon]|nr:hypothetical protein [Candidatus Lokiarchaeota archaeon]
MTSNLKRELDSRQAKALEELEKLIGKKIPQVEKITGDRNPQGNKFGLEKFGSSFGVKIEEGNIIGLSLYDCGLSTLPESIGYLKSLQILYLRNNNITNLPESFRTLDSLQILSLWRNNITNLPESILSLQSLQELWLQYNNLSTLPNSITNLKSLIYLNLGKNRFTEFPEILSKLSSLQKLMLWDNLIPTIPDSIGNLNNLQTLGLNGNKLTSIPLSFRRLKSLINLDLSDNPWEGEWKGIENDTTKRVLELCRQRAPIMIYLCYSLKDEKQYNINNIMQDLKNRKEIQDIYIHGEQKFLDSHLFLFIATKDSLNDEQCQQELKLAVTHDIPIIPIKASDIKWENLNKITLGMDYDMSEKLGFEIECSDELRKEKDFYDTLYEYIKKYKRMINLFDAEDEKIDKQWLNIKIICEKIINSIEFKEIYFENAEKFKTLDEKLKTKQISLENYVFKIGQILKSKKDL